MEGKGLLDNKKYNLKSDEYGFSDCDLDTLSKIFQDMLRLLREEKITFWERLFEEYKKDKEGYVLDFRTKRERFDKDLDRVSKITSEVLKNVFKEKP